MTANQLLRAVQRNLRLPFIPVLAAVVRDVELRLAIDPVALQMVLGVLTA
jgi:hypothetical protein